MADKWIIKPLGQHRLEATTPESSDIDKEASSILKEWQSYESSRYGEGNCLGDCTEYQDCVDYH
jgi:hypothetical protein